MKKTTLHIIGIMTMVLPTLSLAAAPDLGRFTTYPSYTQKGDTWIVRDVRPGERYREYITLENLGAEPLSLTIDIVESSGQKPQIKLLEDTEPQNAGKWIAADKKEVHLAGYAKQNIGLDIAIPENTPLGEYQAVALVSEQPDDKEQLKINTRIGNRIYLNVTGNKDLQSNTFTPPDYQLHIAMIILSVAGIVYGTLPHKQKQTIHYENSKV